MIETRNSAKQPIGRDVMRMEVGDNAQPPTCQHSVESRAAQALDRGGVEPVDCSPSGGATSEGVA